MSSAGEEVGSTTPAEVEASTLITLRRRCQDHLHDAQDGQGDKLRVLIGFYLDMVTPTDKQVKGAAVAAVAAAASGGVFMHYGRCVTGDRTPADYDMEDGDEVSFFPDGTRTMPVTLTVKDNKGRRVTHTMRRLDVICTLFRLYFDMLPSTAPREGVFMYNGREISFYQTPEKCDMNDGDEITFHPFSKPSTFVTLTIKGSSDDGGRSGVVVTRPMRRTDELQRLIDYYFAMVPTDDQNREWAVTYCGRQVGGEKTPADYEMEDGDQLRLVPASKPSRFVTVNLLTMVKAERTYTLRRTDKLQGLMDLCLSREPASMYRHGCVLAYEGRRVHGSQTPDDLKLEDGDIIYALACQVG
uniref:Ubiquitin-like domain-containing protein n=1 Tax=Oryza glumipatula TaxID=40148 RepID=A0A0D9Y8M5_9ORYZ